MKLRIEILPNFAKKSDPRLKSDSLLHQPLIWLNDEEGMQFKRPALELLSCLQGAGLPDEEIARGKSELETTGSTVFESNSLDFGHVLKTCEQERYRPLAARSK